MTRLLSNLATVVMAVVVVLQFVFGPTFRDLFPGNPPLVYEVRSRPLWNAEDCAKRCLASFIFVNRGSVVEEDLSVTYPAKYNSTVPDSPPVIHNVTVQNGRWTAHLGSIRPGERKWLHVVVDGGELDTNILDVYSKSRLAVNIDHFESERGSFWHSLSFAFLDILKFYGVIAGLVCLYIVFEPTRWRKFRLVAELKLNRDRSAKLKSILRKIESADQKAPNEAEHSVTHLQA